MGRGRIDVDPRQRQRSQISPSLVRVCHSCLILDVRGACVAAMCVVYRGAELSILSFFDTRTLTDRSLPSHASPDSAHRPRLAEVALHIPRVTGLQHFTSCVKAGA